MGVTGYVLIFDLLLIVAAVWRIIGEIWQKHWKKGVMIVIGLLAFLGLQYGALLHFITSM